MGSPSPSGISACYNGLDIHQTTAYIKISCKNYDVRCILQSHGWDTPGASEAPDCPDLVPLHPDVATRIALLHGYDEGATEHKQLAQQQGFSYGQLLGELIYAYVLVCLDIGFAVCFLARFLARPCRALYSSQEHCSLSLCYY